MDHNGNAAGDCQSGDESGRQDRNPDERREVDKGEAERWEMHKLRATVDAIMAGANTVIHDDPRLTVRHGVSGKEPCGVVVDGHGRCPRTASLFTDAHRQHTIVLTPSRSPARWRRNLGQL